MPNIFTKGLELWNLQELLRRHSATAFLPQRALLCPDLSTPRWLLDFHSLPSFSALPFKRDTLCGSTEWESPPTTTTLPPPTTLPPLQVREPPFLIIPGLVRIKSVCACTMLKRFKKKKKSKLYNTNKSKLGRKVEREQ